MAEVTVSIAGRTYRMACNDGDEPHLAKLAALFDGKVEELRGTFGQIGDMRLQVMAALMLADELSEAKERIEALEAQSRHAEATELRLAEAINSAAERIELLAKSLNPPAPANPSP
ncbi:MAG TPA: cell division protein ZapA [Beijerinckiaceae bacterium]|nr:cell division protein ZapA [Beijerinckiaceae bacterium]